MIIEKFNRIVERYEHKVAVKDGENSLTYGELDREAGRLARLILQRFHAPGIEPGEQIAALLFDHGINQVIALLAVLKAGKIYVPLDPAYPEKRLEFMLRDSGARMILADNNNIKLARELAAGSGDTWRCGDKNVHGDGTPAETSDAILAVQMPPHAVGLFKKAPLAAGGNNKIDETLVDGLFPDIELPGSSGDRPAYILYTSGSSGNPKGVVQTCGNVVFYAERYIDALSITPGDRLTYLSSFSHDGAVQDIYGAILGGAALYPFDIKTTPGPGLAGSFIKEGITIYHSVPTVFRYFAGSLGGREEYSSLRLIVTGGEPLYPADIAAMRRLFPGAAAAHMYGQTESSVNSMGFIDPGKDDGAEISLGDALEGVELLLLDDNGEEVLGFETAGIFVACAHIAPGYWRSPAETAKVFLEDEELGKVYRTGDLGRRNYAGRIEFKGRKDNQVKINGFRVELYEIERLLKQYEGVDNALVTAREKSTAGSAGPGVLDPAAPGEQVGIRLIAYIVSQTERTEPELREYLSRHLPHYMIPSYFVFLEEVPLTPNGKIDRNALPEPETGVMTEYMAPRNQVEERLAEVWSGVLGREVGICDNFFHLGGDSIKAIQVSARLRGHDLELKIGDLFLHPRIIELAGLVEKIQRNLPRESVKGAGPGGGVRDIPREQLARINAYVWEHIPGSPEIEAVYPLTPMQKTMLYYSLSGTNKEVFFIQYLFPWQGNIDPSLLETAVNRLVQRHDILRTNFIHRDLDEPLQIVFKQRKVEFHYEDIGGREEEEKKSCLDEFRQRDIERGFDLSKDMLLRVTLFRTAAETYYLVWSKHYILMDGWCVGIVFNELVRIYECLRTGKPVELEKTYPYRDYIAWLEGQDKAAGFGYWRDYLAGYLHRGGLVPTRPGPVKPVPNGRYQFKTHVFAIGEGEIRALQQLAACCEVTLNIVFQALWGVLLQRYNNRDDVVFGAVVSGRPPQVEGIENMVGLFINTVPVRVKAPRDYRFSQLLKHMQRNSGAAKSYEYLPFTEILSQSRLSENIIDNLMTFQNFVLMEQFKNSYTGSQPGENAEPASRPETALFHQSNYNFNIIITPITPFRVTFMYNAPYYDGDFVKRVEQHLRESVGQVIENKDIQLKDIHVSYDYIAAESSILQQEKEEEWNI